MKIKTDSPEKTQLVAEKLAALLQKGDVIALFGDLGMGKTCFTQGLAKGLDIKGLVKSPTFQIVREHQGRLMLYHFDLYRISSPDELYEIGFEDYVYGEGVVIIEWPEMAEDMLPEERLEIHFEHTGVDERELTFIPVGERAAVLAGQFVR